MCMRLKTSGLFCFQGSPNLRLRSSVKIAAHGVRCCSHDINSWPFQIDPAGQYFGYKAAAAGTKDQEVGFRGKLASLVLFQCMQLVGVAFPYRFWNWIGSNF